MTSVTVLAVAGCGGGDATGDAEDALTDNGYTDVSCHDDGGGSFSCRAVDVVGDEVLLVVKDVGDGNYAVIGGKP